MCDLGIHLLKDLTVNVVVIMVFVKTSVCFREQLNWIGKVFIGYSTGLNISEFTVI